MPKKKPETKTSAEAEYLMSYQLQCHSPPIKKSEIPEGHGACDAIAVFSILFDSEVDTSYVLQGIDGRTGSEMNHKQLFRIWTLMATTLGEKMDDGGERDICLEVVRVMDRARALMEADVAEEDSN